jgi:hypothetical protein
VILTGVDHVLVRLVRNLVGRHKTIIQYHAI